MAIDLGTETTSIKERTYKVEILTGVGEDPTVRVYREKVWLDPNGTVVRREEAPMAVRLLSHVATQSFNGVTGLQLATTIATVADTFRTEDIG